MALKPLDKSWGNQNKNFNYVGKDFATLKQNLIDFTKTYFPDSYSDFSEASPGSIFIEQAAAIGDMLSFYQDTQLKESILSYASEKKNVLALAQSMGYKPKLTSPAVTTLTIYQIVPSIGVGTANKPDDRFYLKIKDGLQIDSNDGVTFRSTDVVDFSLADGREIDVYERDTNTQEPSRYLITKKVKAISATEKTTTISFTTNDVDYPTATIVDSNIIAITSVVDEDNIKYYEGPYLAQE